MWLSGGGNGDAADQACHIRACCRYFFAVHADLHTLRNGVTLVIDATDKTLGMARKLQEIWQQNLPLRPQNIYILGTNPVARLLVNAITTIASIFLKKKVISRIRHVDLTTLASLLGPTAMPPKHSGSTSTAVDEWVSDTALSVSRHI
mmetsp:Transcript_29274/g.71095  ORF Transcript_29274/g.71095 Transcript_29274/m.71095 type:complete len:148 (-) Transcript_29274:29-472(-)